MLVGCSPAGGSTSADRLPLWKSLPHFNSCPLLLALWSIPAAMPVLGSMPPCVMNFYAYGTISQNLFFFRCKLFVPWYSMAAKRRNERGQHPNGQVAQGFRADPGLSLKMDWFKKWKLHMQFCCVAVLGLKPGNILGDSSLMVCLPVFLRQGLTTTSDCPSTFCVAQVKLITVLHLPPRIWDESHVQISGSKIHFSEIKFNLETKLYTLAICYHIP